MNIERTWHPISEIHEDFGNCILVNFRTDPAHLRIGSNLDTDFHASDWTHFTRVPPMSFDEALILIEELTDNGDSPKEPA